MDAIFFDFFFKFIFKETNVTQSHVKMAPSASGIIKEWMVTDANAHLISLGETVRVTKMFWPADLLTSFVT